MELQTTIRNAAVCDAQSIATLFQRVYGESSHPCKNAQAVEQGILSGSTLWQLAVAEEQVIACVASMPNTWNRSWELGRGVVLPEYRKAGLGSKLLWHSLQRARQSAFCDVLIGFPRNRSMMNMLRRLDPSFVPVGHDGAINVANNQREYHAISFTPNPSAAFRHHIPSSGSLADEDFVAEKIFRPLCLKPDEAAYPPQLIVGAGSRRWGPFSIECEPRCASRSLEITGYHENRQDAAEAIAALRSMLRAFHQVEHVRLTVLVDKKDFIRRLVDLGFEVTAYLPAWYSSQGARFDCVLMVKAEFASEPVDHGTRDEVLQFRQGLNAQIQKGTRTC
jgi:GNAT superfamily N-acetyltransferase